VLQERSFYRVGGAEEVQVDVRVIAATHVNLEQAVAAGRFREDLFYRLNVIEVRIPPLRERREDIPLLAGHFVERIAGELRKDPADLSEGALRALVDHEWPGNVRELENAIERAVVTCRGRTMTEDDFAFLGHAADGRRPWSVPTNLSLQEIEKQAIEATLRRHGGNITETAATLGIERSTLYEKIKKYAIER
jgi:two-component system response regulator HydG